MHKRNPLNHPHFPNPFQSPSNWNQIFTIPHFAEIIPNISPFIECFNITPPPLYFSSPDPCSNHEIRLKRAFTLPLPVLPLWKGITTFTLPFIIRKPLVATRNRINHLHFTPSIHLPVPSHPQPRSQEENKNEKLISNFFSRWDKLGGTCRIIMTIEWTSTYSLPGFSLSLIHPQVTTPRPPPSSFSSSSSEWEYCHFNTNQILITGPHLPFLSPYGTQPRSEELLSYCLNEELCAFCPGYQTVCSLSVQSWWWWCYYTMVGLAPESHRWSWSFSLSSSHRVVW